MALPLTDEDLLITGQLQGKIAGFSRKDWSLFYLEVSSVQLHIFEGHEDLTVSRKHLRSLEIDAYDSVVAEKDRKTYRFTIKRADGSYTFKCDSEITRKKWIAALERLVHKKQFQHMPGFRTPTSDAFDPDQVGRRTEGPKRVDVPQVPSSYRSSTLPSSSRTKISHSALNQPLPPVPGGGGGGGGGGSGAYGRDSCSSSSSESGSGSGIFNGNDDIRRLSKVVAADSKMSTDSGIGASGGGQVTRKPYSGDGTHHRQPIKTKQTSTSDGGQFAIREELDNYKWFWGNMNRADSEAKMKAEGKIGNFAIRVNATGSYVMTFWRSDSIHHHRIIHQCGIYRFEKTAVAAEGNGLVDLLDNYMKVCTDKEIVPIGGVLHLVYDEAWNPPDIDMDQLQQKLREKKGREDRNRLLRETFQPPEPQNPRKRGEKKEEYTMVTPTSNAREDEFTQSTPAVGVQQINRQLKVDGRNPTEVLPATQMTSETRLSTKPLPSIPPAKPKEGGKKKPLPLIPPSKNKKPSPLLPTKEVHVAVEPSNRSPVVNRSPVTDRRHEPLPAVPDSSTAPQPKPTPSPKIKRGPTPAPRNKPNKPFTKSPTSPTLPSVRVLEDRRDSEPVSSTSTTCLTPPLHDQAVYENTNFGIPSSRVRMKKSPVPRVRSPGHQSPAAAPTNTDSGGEVPYQNTSFGDSGNDEAFYANVVRPPVSQKKGGRARLRDENGHPPVQPPDNVEQHSSSYQNMEFDQGEDPSLYQNIQFPGRGHKSRY